MPTTQDYQDTAQKIRQADALIITAGAGMGVDSGLPDFRGNTGFWKAYPAYAKLGLEFSALANPDWFDTDPNLAWGFYGHRRNLYRTTTPHKGFSILRRWANRAPQGHFIYTSNVDGQFQKAGFNPNNIVEAHGAIDHLQCTRRCDSGIFPGGKESIDIDESTFRARGNLPKCKACGALARPNIMMFGDPQWNPDRTLEQRERMNQWLLSLNKPKVTIIEIGAGTGIPTIRNFSENMTDLFKGTLIRINVRESATPRGHISLDEKALIALESIDMFY